MTNVYFIRHAEPNFENHEDALRELTEKGKKDRELVTRFLGDKEISAVLSSPFLRAVETVQDFADRYGFAIKLVPGFRERRVDSVWIDDFEEFCKKQWADFSYKYQDGETLSEVQERNISALHQVLRDYRDQNTAVGSHGTALSTILNYYDPSFGYEEFQKIRRLMPWIVKFSFSGEELVSVEKTDVFRG